MFTGIVEEIGAVLNIKEGQNFLYVIIKAAKVIENLNLGDSIAVNGVCLTVTDFNKDSFTADVMGETIRKSSLKTLKKGSLVNLERALTLNKPLGGHIVSGHIDGIGEIKNIKTEAIATFLTIKAQGYILKYLVSKGSVALDGVSLTLVQVERDCFTVSLIPHTKEKTILNYKSKGDIVNIECDVIGKYIYKFMNLKIEDNSKNNSITLEMLTNKGFL
ncbi:riboflavin synthase [Clostridium niameyense]|uniref:Riboflavin synthase n=1 Tax=Clostridium niameyense TaxID=1622073 RepID=A0A6M0R6G0_9CLOT|nr:riboflavin synthase [Clostridium niameyense]NEZ45753.1 riboflavin synthase [Clostridium niameyense]